MSNSEKQELGAFIGQAFRDSTPGWHEFMNKADEETRWSIANSFTYALNGEVLELLTGRITNPSTAEMEFAGFTKNHVIYFKGQVGFPGPTWQVIQRSSLELLEVVSAPDVLPLPSMRFEVRTAKFKLSYGNAVQFDFPMDSPAREIGDEFIRSLWADLDAKG